MQPLASAQLTGKAAPLLQPEVATDLPQLPQNQHGPGSQHPHPPREALTVSKFGNLETSSLQLPPCARTGPLAGLFLTAALECVRALLYLSLLYNYPCSGGVMFEPPWS